MPTPPPGAAEALPAHGHYLPAEGLPAEAGGLMATRRGGVSRAPFDSLNLRPAGLRGDATDDPASIHENQRRFAGWVEGAQPVYLDQVHGTRVVRLGHADLGPGRGFHQADASITTERGIACTVLVADCLPVLFAAPGARAVGAAHAGWRGLAGGVLEATLAAVCEAAECEAGEVSAWLGACIGPQAFEVGDDVRDAFAHGGHAETVAQPEAEAFFRAGVAPGKWWADLPGLARWRLQQAGVSRLGGGRWCTYSEPSHFFSYRRDRLTGRHAAAIWIR